LKALVTRPESEPRPRNWRQVLTELRLDPWKQEYYYERPGKHNPKDYDIYSAGPDNRPNTEDDIGNWESTTPQ
jgi:general secretion pathway protein G